MIKEFVEKRTDISDREIIHRVGTIRDMHYTAKKNLIIECFDIKKINTNDDVHLASLREESFFLVPKRRESLIKKIWSSAKHNKQYVFKLEKESFSKKYCVSEIFVIGDNIER